jgi:hypothetical protein
MSGIKLSDCREEVQMFAMAMEAKLRENDHKGGWKDEGYYYFDGRLHQELLELERAFSDLRYDENNFEKRLALFKECADIANFTMMIADSFGLLELA